MTQSNLVRAFVLANSLWAMAAFAQVPSTVAFTGNLTGSGGPASGAHNFVFKLFDAAANGNVSWTETQALVSEETLSDVQPAEPRRVERPGPRCPRQ